VELGSTQKLDLRKSRFVHLPFPTTRLVAIPFQADPLP